MRTRQYLRLGSSASIALLVAVSVLLGAVLPAAARNRGPHVMTTSSWDGVRLRASLTKVAAAHGWSAESCSGTGAPQFISGEDLDGVEIAQGARPGRVGFIEVYRDTIRGPHGLRVDATTSTIRRLLHRGAKHHVYLAADEWWNYWVIRTKTGYLYVRTGDGDGDGTPDRVWSFGLAASRAVARDRGTTQGGCY